MSYLYNTQEDIASKIKDFFKFNIPSIRKTQINIIPYIAIGMINSESIVSSDIAKTLKDDFSLVQYDSIVRRIRRFFNNKLFNPYSFYESIIKYVISNYKVKHSNNTIHIVFDHMYSKENYTILMFSLRIGKQGIPLLFKCFDGINNPKAFLDSTITDCIKTISNYFKDTNYKLVFLADRWFNSEMILKTIDDLNHTYVIRLKGNIKVNAYDYNKRRYIDKYADDLASCKYKGKYYKDVYLYDSSSFKSNIVLSNNTTTSTPWILVTNGNCNEAIKFYSYRFGAIECIFKNQKSNGFYLESVCNASLKAFTSMYSILCFCILFLTIIGCDYTKNRYNYSNIKLETHKTYNGVKKRVMSLFNTGLTLFHLAFCSNRYIKISTRFILYDV